MKKTTLFMALMLAVAMGASAQFKIGAKMGTQLTTLTGDDDFKQDRKMRLGINTGVVMEVGNKVAFSTGLLFSTQGVKWSFGDEKYIIRMTYLRIPLEVKVNIGDQEKTVSGYVHAGPYLAFWLTGREIDVYNGDRASEGIDFDGDYDRRIDVGIGAGGGISLNFGKHVIQAGPSFGMGFLDINKYPDGKPDDVKANLHSVIGVMNVTYLFNTKG